MRKRNTNWNRLGIASCLMLCSGGVIAQPANQTIDRAKLLQSVPLPKMDAGFMLEFNTNLAPSDEAARGQIAEISRLKQALTPDQLLQLGQLYSQLKDTTNARANESRAVTLLRRNLAVRPDDLALLLSLGTALRRIDQLDEAETTLRRAIKVSPNLASAWTMLGEVLLAKATKTVVPAEQEMQFKGGVMPAFDTLGPTILNFRPTPAAITLAETELEEARLCYAKAIEVAPLDAQVYQNRVGFRMGATFLTALLKNFQANPAATLKDTLAGGAQTAMGQLFSQETVSELQIMARLKPENASLQGIAGLATVLVYATGGGGSIPLKGGLTALPAPVAAPVRDDITRLEAISKRGGQDTATALQSLGFLSFVLDDPAATDQLRRAVTLDPNQQQAWGMLVALLASKDNYGELAKLTQARLENQNTVRNHLILAKAYDKLGRAGDAANEVDAALQQDPKDVTANLAKSAFFFRAGNSAQGKAQLNTITDVPESQKSDYALLQGISSALAGQVEAAREQWQKVLASEPQNESAQKLLATLS